MQESSFALSSLRSGFPLWSLRSGSLRSGAARATGGAAFRRDQPESVAFWRALLTGAVTISRPNS